MTETPTLPVHALAAWLAANLDDGSGGDWSGLTLRAFVGGQSNPTYLMESGGRRFVLHKKPPGVLLPSAHAIEREYRVMQALADTAVPVPAMRAFCDDATVIGTPFFIMDHVEGRVLRAPSLPDMPARERTRLYDAMVATLAALHEVDPVAAGLGDFGRPQGYYERQVRRWTDQYRAAETETLPAMEQLIAWLPAHCPAHGRVSLVHGDYRLENLIVDTAAPRVAAVLDWELSTLGDPLGDLAYHCLPWHLPPHAFGGLAGTDLAGSGIPGEADYLAAYFARTGRAGIEDWGFYVAFAAFRLAAILQGVLKRAQQGNAASPDALERGRLAVVCAEVGWNAARGQRQRSYE